MVTASGTSTLGQPLTLQDSVLRVYDQDGITVLATNDDAAGLGMGSYIRFNAAFTGIYYAEVTGKNGTLTGTYEISIHADDHGDNAVVDTGVLIPGTRPGELELPNDIDWFIFTATAGHHYLFDIVPGSARRSKAAADRRGWNDAAVGQR